MVSKSLSGFSLSKKIESLSKLELNCKTRKVLLQIMMSSVQNSEQSAIDIRESVYEDPRDLLNDFKTHDPIRVSSSETRLIKFVSLFVILILVFPLSFCDLYFAVNDNSCVNLPAGKLAITMQTFLLVNGIYSFIMFGIVSVVICCANLERLEESVGFKFISMIFETVIKLFSMAWIIIGSIIFWHLMDSSKCSDTTYNYLFASLVIRIVSSILLFKNNGNK